MDSTAAALPLRRGWIIPDDSAYPTGEDLVRKYLEPLAATPELAPHIRVNTRVAAVSRRGRDRMKDAGRDEAPFVVRAIGLAG